MFDTAGAADGTDGAAGPADAAGADAADVRRLSDEELMARVQRMEAARRALDAAEAHVVAELDARGATDRATGLRTTGWLGFAHRLASPTAGALVACGSFLRTHPVIDAALVAGHLTLDHVRLLARLTTPRVADFVAEAQERFVELAVGVRFERWARDVRALVELADGDGAEPPIERNRLTMDDLPDGTLLLGGALVGDAALGFREAVIAEAQRLLHQYRRDAEATDGETTIPPPAALYALALANLVAGGRVAAAGGAAPVADVALVITTPEDEAPCPVDGESRGHWLDGLLVRTLDRMPVRPSVARLLCCDATFRPLVEDAHGEVLHLGRRQRLASAAQRRAVAHRFGGCCFPGCDAPMAWVDLHHVEHWEDGGHTDLDLLAPLCRHHHRVVHRRGWSVRPAEHGFEIVTPRGNVMPAHRFGRPPDELAPPA